MLYVPRRFCFYNTIDITFAPTFHNRPISNPTLVQVFLSSVGFDKINFFELAIWPNDFVIEVRWPQLQPDLHKPINIYNIYIFNLHTSSAISVDEANTLDGLLVLRADLESRLIRGGLTSIPSFLGRTFVKVFLIRTRSSLTSDKTLGGIWR